MLVANKPPPTLHQVMVPKLIHPLPPNTPTTPKSPSSRSDDIEDEPSMAHAGANDTWMQVCGGIVWVAAVVVVHNGWWTHRLSTRSGHPHLHAGAAYRGQ